MSFLPSPQLPQYRVTLFYGPEPVEGKPKVLHCVFNVKKRSWKGGVQVVVEVAEPQMERAKQALGLAARLERTMAHIPDDERADYRHRAGDLFVQAICGLKLDLAIEAGLQQENRTLDGAVLIGELDRAVREQSDRIMSQLLAELDIPQKAEG
jgi:hypothetical protein